MLYSLLIVFVALYSWQVVKSPSSELAQCLTEAVTPPRPLSLPPWAELQAQAYAAAPSPESSEDPSIVRPLVEKYFDISAGVDITHLDDDSSSTE